MHENYTTCKRILVAGTRCSDDVYRGEMPKRQAMPKQYLYLSEFLSVFNVMKLF
jgi:hypothetical protein